MKADSPGVPVGATTTTVTHRVGFHETDAMGIVHHANYLHHFESARVAWLETHDQPYTAWIAADRQFAVTRVELDYRRPARFDDRIEITTWLEGVGGASLAMGYVIRRRDEILVTGRTEHASVDGQGRVRRLPPADRTRLASRALAAQDGADASARPGAGEGSGTDPRAMTRADASRPNADRCPGRRAGRDPGRRRAGAARARTTPSSTG